MEELFKKTPPVAVKSSERGERLAAIGITILLNVVTTPVHKKELVVRLTDETDPFFLFTLALGEEDFQGLKSQQGLLVDFSAFPQKFIDLLQLCLSEAGKDSPKFLLELSVSSSDRGFATLSIVETNPFRHLNHLSLKFVPASDAYLKKYLAECLLKFKDDNGRLSETLTATRTDLTAQLAQCEQTLARRSQELESLKSEWSAHTSTLTSEHAASLTAEREKAVETQSLLQARSEQERREAEQTHASRLEGLEVRLRELDVANKELTDHKYRSEAAIRELRTKLKTAEEECAGVRQELQAVRRENSSLDSRSHEQDKTLGQLRTSVAVLEQELRDKEQVIGRTSELLEASAEHKKSCELALEQSQRQVSKLDTAFKTASQEVLKGNQIIQKLQAELHNVKSKLKLKNMVTTQQERLLGERETALQRQKHELDAVRESLAQKQDEVRKLEGALEENRQRLEESKEQLKTDENVIAWLNKQMNEQMMPRATRPAMMSSGDVLSTIRQSPPSHPHPFTSTTSFPPHQRPQFSSTPANPQHPSGLASQIQPGRQVLGSLASQENSRQQVMFRGPMMKKNSGIPVPSPLSAHSLPAAAKPTTITTSTPPAANRVGDGGTEGEAWLHPKYLPPPPPQQQQQQQPAVLLRPPPASTVTPGVVKPSPPPGTQIPLMSAYFPKS